MQSVSGGHRGSIGQGLDYQDAAHKAQFAAEREAASSVGRHATQPAWVGHTSCGHAWQAPSQGNQRASLTLPGRQSEMSQLFSIMEYFGYVLYSWGDSCEYGWCVFIWSTTQRQNHLTRQNKTQSSDSG